MQKNIKQQARQHFNTGNLEKARTLYETYVEQNPNDPEVLYMLGAVYGRIGDFTLASNYFSKTLELQPDAFVAICGLGAAEKQLGNLETAIQTFQKALKFQPDNTNVLLELAGLLLRQSKLGDAEILLHRILKSNPECAEAHHGLGGIYQSKKKIDTAIIYYKQALKYDGKRAVTHNQLGSLLSIKGFLKEAINHFKTAISIKPDFLEAYINLGQNYLVMGSFKKALDAFEKTLKIKPDYSGAIACTASVYEKQGKPDKAYNIIEPWLKKMENYPDIGLVFSSIANKLDKRDEAITYINKLLQQKLPDETKEALHYELGKLLDKKKQYKQAFVNFKAANELRANNFRPAEYTAYMDAVKRVFNWQFMQSAPKSSYQTETPIFIVGMPRSGTSLTEQILNSHAEISGAGELQEIDNYTMEISTRLDPGIGYPHSLSGVSTELLDIFAKRFENYLRTAGFNSRFVTDKMPQNYMHLGLISLMFPKTKIIHCIRNPLDTCLSIYMQSFNESHEYANSLNNIAYYYMEYKRLMEHWNNMPNISIHNVDYEQLVLEPENTVRKLLDFIEVDWDPNCLKFYESKRHIPTASYDQVRNKLYTSSINRWKNYEDNLGQLINTLSPHISDLKNE